jgi:hypothetical protein
MGTNQCRLDRIEKNARGIAHAKDEREARRIVRIWNARHAKGCRLWYYPTIGAALTAGSDV